VSWLAINDPRFDKCRLLSIFTAAKQQVICLIFSTMVQKRCWLDTIAGAR